MSSYILGWSRTFFLAVISLPSLNLLCLNNTYWIFLNRLKGQAVFHCLFYLIIYAELRNISLFVLTIKKCNKLSFAGKYITNQCSSWHVTPTLYVFSMVVVSVHQITGFTREILRALHTFFISILRIFFSVSNSPAIFQCLHSMAPIQNVKFAGFAI